MNRRTKRLFALVVALMLTLTTVTGMALPAFAAESDPGYEYTDSYVLMYEGSDEIPEAYQQYCKPYLYASPHMSTMSIRNLDTGKMISWYCSQQVYNMINTSKLAEGGAGAYASIEVYCTDACINANGGSSYQRINLEDATYFDDTTAGRIRAVFLSSFPYIKNMDTITANVNAWLAQQGGEYTEVSNLTAAEVVTATQYTIWILANGDDVQAKKSYSYTEEYTAEDLADEVIYISNEYMDCTEDARETTANNIAMVQKYLESLAPVGPQKQVISDALLTVVDFSKTKEADGTYTMNIAYTVDAQLSAEDDLVLTATCGDTRKNIQLTTENLSGTISLTGVKASEEVKLEVNGYQVGGDVYFFDSTGDRSGSQSMVGYDGSQLPVHAEASVESSDHVLNIYKSTSEADGKKPLANIEFELYYVASMNKIAAGDVTLSQEPTAEEIAEYKTADNLVATLKTDAAGFATYNFTENGKADGVYLIVEKPNAAVVEPVTPFYVAIPGTSADGTTAVNTVKVYPKNATESGPDIKKDVTQIENDHDTFDVDQIHTWIIRGGVPAGIADAKKYVIYDTLDYRLTYKGNLAVKVGLETDKAGEEAVTLTVDTDYSVSVGTDTDLEGNTVDTFFVALTDAGMDAVAAAVGSGKVADYEVRVYFDAVIDTDAQMGTQIPNQATLEYTNNLGVEYDAESDVPEVHTGGTNIWKVDSKENTPLAGATFQIARDATEAELEDANVVKEQLVIGDTEHTVVFAEFYATADLTGEKVSQVTTDDTGAAMLYGLAYGEYYIVETKAPAGYNLLNEPVVIQIDEDSHSEENVLTIVNTQFVVPETGGMGTVMFTAVGIGMIAAAVVLLGLNLKKKKA